MGIVDDLLANPGTYLGIDREIQRGGDSAAKIDSSARDQAKPPRPQSGGR